MNTTPCITSRTSPSFWSNSAKHATHITWTRHPVSQVGQVRHSGQIPQKSSIISVSFAHAHKRHTQGHMNHPVSHVGAIPRHSSLYKRATNYRALLRKMTYKESESHTQSKTHTIEDTHNQRHRTQHMSHEATCITSRTSPTPTQVWVSLWLCVYLWLCVSLWSCVCACD